MGLSLKKKDTPHWELLFSTVLNHRTSPSGQSHRCQKNESTITVRPVTKNICIWHSVCSITGTWNYSYRVPTQVLQSLIKSYIDFSICKALQSVIFWYFRQKRSYKVLFRIKNIQALRNGSSHLGSYVGLKCLYS